MEANAMFKTQVNDRGKIRLITGKLDAEFRTWKIKTPLLQVKLFKPPVVRETISIIRKCLYQRELFSFLSQIKISLHFGIYFTNSTLWLTAAEIREEAVYSQS